MRGRAGYDPGMLAKIFGLAIVMILAFSAALIGGILIAVGREPMFPVGLVVVGLSLGAMCVRWIVWLNRRYQDEALAAVLANPVEIVARWWVGRDEVILAQRGLFVGRAYYAFAAAYQRMIGLHLSPDGRRLILEYSNVAAEEVHTREVEVTPEVVPAIQAFIAGGAGRSAGPR